MGEKTKSLLIGLLIIGLVAMTVAYAALSQTLTISSSAKVESKSSNWDIHFDNLAAASGSPHGYATIVSPLTKSAATTLSGLNVTLKAPGDYVSYTFDVVNGGTINAKIDTNGVSLPDVSTISMAGDTTTGTADIAIVRANLEYTLVYGTGDAKAGQAPAVNDTLNAGQTRHMVLTIKYKDNANNLPTNDVTISALNASLTYVQADASN